MPATTSAIGYPRWREAQQAEHAYWYPAAPMDRQRRRQEERERMAWYAGTLGLPAPELASRSVLELGAGPQGLVTAFPGASGIRRIAVEPMPLEPEDLARYVLAGVALVQCPAESYRGEPVDEVWMTNVLQHVIDPVAVLRTARQHARQRVRLVEWVRVPESVVHPHVITVDLVHEMFADWVLERHLTGRYTTPSWSQEFLAVVYEREEG
jgi:hypothetical protein